MRISLPEPDPRTIERLQQFASRNPGLYRLRLTMLAVLGDAVLTFVQVFPWAIGAWFGALWYGHLFFYWLAGLATLFFIWLFRPKSLVRGEKIEAAQAPALFQATDRLRAGVEMRHAVEVRLNDDMNASALDTRGLFGLLGSRYVLTLGIPLLTLLTREEAEAVIAHEFGHFSRRHGRLGHWLYRAHIGWLQHAGEIDASSSVLDKAGAGFAHLFVPYFSTRCLVHSRQCEFEADADAARATSAAMLAAALTRLDVFEQWQMRGAEALIAGWQRASLLPPEDLMQATVRSFHAVSPSEIEALCGTAMTVAADWRNTHPALSLRLAALQQTARLPHATRSAGEDWFGSRWRTIVAEHEARSNAVTALFWAASHIRCTQVDAPLLAADRRDIPGWPLELKLAHADALRRVEPARGLAALADLYQTNPTVAAAAFAYGCALLDQGHAKGAALLEQGWNLDARLRAPAYTSLMSYHVKMGDMAGAHRLRDRLQRARQRRSDAVQQVVDRFDRGEAEPALLPKDRRQALFALLQLEPRVHEAWLIGGEAPLATAELAQAAMLKVHVLHVSVEPSGVAVQVTNDYDISAALEPAMQRLLPPEDQIVVTWHYTTEQPSAPHARRLALVPASQCYRSHPSKTGTLAGRAR